MLDFPITEAQLTGNFCETLVYGIYLVTCISCFKALLMIGKEERWRKPNEIRWIMVVVAFLLFWISTFDVANGLYHNIRAFVQYKGPGGATQDLTNIHDWVNVARSFDQTIAMTLGDFVLIYRCWIVYSKRWLVVIPSFILYLAGIAMAIKLMIVEITLSYSNITLNSGEIRPWWSAFFAITMAQNVITTALLIWRIWKVERENSKFRRSGPTSGISSGPNSIPYSVQSTPSSQPALRRVIRVVAESGAAYTLLVFMTFVVSVCNSNALYPLSDATLVATGVCFNVIIARCSPRRDQEFTQYDTQMRSHMELGTGQSHSLNTLRLSGHGMKPYEPSHGTKVRNPSDEGIQVAFKTEVHYDSQSINSRGEQRPW
ncbi:hypothetical protein DL96DRAFT_1605787 [Flagelloscypha sp. PMI_526]|nr:hypothetical protein DL96DRAFT_1605787 [Flagelloscypha sp. PMI_526]